MSKPNALAWRGTVVIAAVAVAGALSGCNSLLDVNNAGAITDDQLDTPQLVNTLANSVLGEWEANFDDFAYYSAIITDEAVTGHNFVQWKDIDLRITRDDNDLGLYADLHAVRSLADTISTRLKNLVPNPQSDVRVARSLAFAGYAYDFMGEFLCESPINVSAKVFTSDEITQMAIPRFEEAITIAQAASGAEATQVLNLARVGLARAYLQLGDDTNARTVASQVPASFGWYVRYSANSGRENNTFFGATTGSNRNLGVAEGFRFLNDPRIRHSATSSRGHNNLTELWTPFQPEAFGDWNPATTAGFARETSIRLASGLEARYIVAEAEGPTAATLALVNERRAVGNEDPVNLSGDALMAELREQRSRDFYMDGHRLGDLRRYKEQGVGDFFPSGPHPNDIWGNYGTDTCFKIALAEKIGNPNLGS